MPDTSSSAAPHAGEIEFGPYPYADAGELLSWPPWLIRPRSGELLLFPSPYAHRTWPTGVPEERIIVAFEVLAADPRGAKGYSATSRP